jgi:1,4-dihydroxy-2-naphthoate octaprenyltransferase
VTDLWRLVRGHNLLIAGLAVFAGGWIALGAVGLPRWLVYAAMSGIGLGAVGNVANDLYDAPADRLNPGAARRPLAAGRVRPATAHLLIWWGGLLGVGAAALVSGVQVAVALGALTVMLGYSPWLKRQGPLGNLAVAVLAGLPLFYGALAVGHPAAGVIPWVLAGWIHLVRELVKDLQDEAGDRAIGRRTLPLRLGHAAAARLAWWGCLVFVPLSIGLPVLGRYPPIYFLVAAPAQLLVIGAGLRVRSARAAAGSLVLKAAMVIGLVALLLGGIA